MKKFIVILYFFLSLTKVFGYELSQEDNQKLIEAKSKLWLLKYQKNINWYYNQKTKIEQTLTKTQNEKEQFMLQELRNETVYIIDSYKPPNFDAIKYTPEIENTTEKNNENSSEGGKKIQEKESIFFDTYGNNIIKKNKLKEGCTKYFDFVDQIAKEHNFPTEMILAIWAKESNCGLFNPYNGLGPFQINSQYHPPGEITLNDFKKSIEQFIDFSRGKIAYYNSNKSYKKRFGEENIDFSYKNYTFKDLQLYAILYNGIGKNTNYQTNKFANGNLNTSLASDTDGVVTLFLKILKWEIENNK